MSKLIGLIAAITGIIIAALTVITYVTSCTAAWLH